MSSSNGNRAYVSLMALLCMAILFQLVLAQRAFVLSLTKSTRSFQPAVLDLNKRTDGWFDVQPTIELTMDTEVSVIEWEVDVENADSCQIVCIVYSQGCLIIRDSGIETW